MDKRFILDTEENIRYTKELSDELLKFGIHFPSDKGSSYYLSDDGQPVKDHVRETWITGRMVHVYSIGSMLGFANGKGLAAKGLEGLAHELKDVKSGGWYAGIIPEGGYLEGKQCYAHAFVILAASSAYLAGVQGAKELLDEALGIYDDKFWDEAEGLSVDTWDTDFKILEDYRGLNANMHTVEAFLAVADAVKEEKYRQRAGRIITRVLKWAEDNDYRIPEHYTKEWLPDKECNSDKKDDPFKPYGATPGHGIEWARLITQWALSALKDDEPKQREYIKKAEKLYLRARSDAWNVDGAPGIAYTTDWNGHPVVRDRMHWTLAEAINTSAVLYRVTGDKKYSYDYSEYMEYLEDKVHDKKNGSWYHQLDANNVLIGTVWPGKSDLYHAFQACLIPYVRPDKSIAADIFDKKALYTT